MDDLRNAVSTLGDDVIDQLNQGIFALSSGDESVALGVIDGDERINERYLALESDCIDLFALQQPVAGDLRFIASSFKILTDLERIGDLATNFGQYSLADTSDPGLDVDIQSIGDTATDMVADAVTAYENEDVEMCFELDSRDDELDTLCHHASEQIVRDLIERDHAADSWTVEQLLDDVTSLLLTIRDLERVGDHAVNVAARTVYLAEGSAELIF